MTWRESVKNGRIIFLATSSENGAPRAIAVASLGLVEGKLLIGACTMRKSLRNIKANPHVSIAARNGGKYYRINGRAAVRTGRWLRIATDRSKPPMPGSAIVVTIREVADLDSGAMLLK